MPSPSETRVVIVGGGAAGRAALELLPDARLVARPEATAWHAEPGLLWAWSGESAEAVPFDALLLAAPCLQLALALGCRAEGWRPAVDGAGRTSVPGVFAAGAILGARTPEEAAEQGRIAARALLGLPTEGAIAARDPIPAPLPPGTVCACLGVTEGQLQASDAETLAEAADLFGLHAGECRMARCGPRLSDAPPRVAPAAPVPLAALAALATERPAPRERQWDAFLQ